jgi:hypothetical protein
MAIVLDPDGLAGAPEIAWITALTAGMGSGTIARGKEGTTAREHARDIPWVHSPVVADFANPWHISIPAETLPFSSVGTWALTQHTDVAPLANGGSGWSNSGSGAQNDEVVYRIPLAAGTWTIRFWHRKSTNVGIYTFLLDGVSVGTIDGYAAAAAFGQNDIAGIAVATTGVHFLTIRMATKNASSSAYYATLQAISITRTA